MIEYCDKNAKDINVSAPFSIRYISFSKFINISSCHIIKNLMMDIILMQNRRVFPKLFLDKKINK